MLGLAILFGVIVGFALGLTGGGGGIFPVMKRVNKEGPKVLGENHTHEMLSLDQLKDAVENGVVVDLRSSADFAKGHVPGTINIPTGMLSPWAGWLIDYDKTTYLIGDPGELEEAARVLHAIGCDKIGGGFDASAVTGSGQATHHFLGRLGDTAEQIPRNTKLVTQCRSGARAAIEASVLQSLGHKDVVNLTGGYVAWKSAGLPSVKSESEVFA